MTCKPAIYVINTSTTPVVANATLPLTSIVRRRTSLIDLGGDAVIVSDKGYKYYLVTVNATFTAPTAGDVTLTLQQNNIAVPGATATETITTANTETRSISFQVIVKTTHCCGLDAFSVLNSGVAATFSNIAVSVAQI